MSRPGAAGWMRGLIGGVVLAGVLAGCAAPGPDASPVPEPQALPVSDTAPDLEPLFVPSLAARPGRPCGDVVGLSSSGPFTAAIVQLGETRSLTPATPEMEACVVANGLEQEFTSPSP